MDSLLRRKYSRIWYNYHFSLTNCLFMYWEIATLVLISTFQVYFVLLGIWCNSLQVCIKPLYCASILCFYDLWLLYILFTVGLLVILPQMMVGSLKYYINKWKQNHFKTLDRIIFNFCQQLLKARGVWCFYELLIVLCGVYYQRGIAFFRSSKGTMSHVWLVSRVS